MSSHRTKSTVFLTLLILALVFPYAGCGGNDHHHRGAPVGPTPNLWVSIARDTNATVGDEGTGTKTDPYDGINYALGFAVSGDVVGVAGGTYEENVVMVDGVDMYGGYDSAFTARDPDVNETIIDGGGGGNAVEGADDAIIDGFTLTNASDGISLGGVSTTVTNNIITGNSSDGVFLYGSSPIGPTVSNNYIYDNGDDGLYIGNYFASETSFPSITNNIVSYNSYSGMSIGGYGYYPNAPSISNNIISYNGRYGITGYSDHFTSLLVPTIENNEIRDNHDGGIGFAAYHEGQVEADIISNRIINNDESGINGFILAYYYPEYTNFPAVSFFVKNNDISENYRGIGLENIAPDYFYTKLDAVISNNVIRRNENEGISAYNYTNDYTASVTTCKINNNVISANKDGGVNAGGYTNEYAGGFISNEMANNLIIGNLGNGVTAYAYMDYASADVTPVHSVNDVVIGNSYDGIAVDADGIDYGVAASYVTIDNSIIRQNSSRDLVSWNSPGGIDQTGFNTNFSNIGDGDSNGDGSVDSGDAINGNISADPLFVNAPDFFDWTTGVGTTTQAVVSDGTLYAVNDVVEIGDDGVARTVTATAAGSFDFTPAFDSALGSDENIKNFGLGGSVNEDYSLSAGSPSIDAGSPLARYLDTDATRNDQGLKGGPLGDTPGTAGVVGIDPALGTPGPQ